MRFYMHNLTDWAKDTAGLDFFELGVYHKMIEIYYLSESPLPTAPLAVCRAIGAITSNEQKAVKKLLENYFVFGEDERWHQKRCDEEIAAYQASIQQNRINGAKRWKGSVDNSVDNYAPFEGVVRPNSTLLPLADTPTWQVTRHPYSPLQRTPTNDNEPSVLASSLTGSQSGRFAERSAGRKAELDIELNTLKRDGVDTCEKGAQTTARQAAVSARQFGFKADPNDPRIAALVADGATPGEFTVAAAKAAAMGKSWAYVIATVSGMRREIRDAQEGPKSGSGGPNYPPLPRAHDPH